MNHLKHSLLLFWLACCLTSFAFPLKTEFVLANNTQVQNQIIPNKFWTDFLTYNGVKIEYKYQVCNSESVKNQILVLFKFSNLNDQKINLTWKTKIWRNNVCRNCDNIYDSEYAHEITLNPNQIIAGDGLSKSNKSLYIFANFIKLSPGMSTQTLTNFEFSDLNSSIIQ